MGGALAVLYGIRMLQVVSACVEESCTRVSSM